MSKIPADPVEEPEVHANEEEEESDEYEDIEVCARRHPRNQRLALISLLYGRMRRRKTGRGKSMMMQRKRQRRYYESILLGDRSLSLLTAEPPAV